MLKINNECMDSADWVESVCGYRPVNNVITFDELDEIRNDERGGGIDGLSNHWDYPLSEINHLIETANDLSEDDSDYEIQLVRFVDVCGGYEYRLCEI